MAKNCKFITIEVTKRKYQLMTNDLKRVFKINKLTLPSISFYYISNLYKNQQESSETSLMGLKSMKIRLMDSDSVKLHKNL